MIRLQKSIFDQKQHRESLSIFHILSVRVVVVYHLVSHKLGRHFAMRSLLETLLQKISHGNSWYQRTKSSFSTT